MRLNILALHTTGADAGRVVELVTGRAAVVVEPGWAWWSAAGIIVGVAAALGVLAIGVWRVRTSGFDGAERAFVALARRQGLGRGARALIRRAAESRGCAPVALLVSPEALAGALTLIGAGGIAAQPSATSG